MLLVVVGIALIIIITMLYTDRERDKKEIKLLNKDIETDRQTIQSMQLTINALNKSYQELKATIPSIIQENRKNAVTTSRSVLKGKISEEIVPLLPDFPYQISDCKFFGSPVDFVIFDGMSNGTINNIIFMDVKTGKASLSPIQRKIRDAVNEGRLIWKTYVREN